MELTREALLAERENRLDVLKQIERAVIESVPHSDKSYLLYLISKQRERMDECQLPDDYTR